MIPMTRADVWEAIDGATNGMDKDEVFLPENSEYRVFQILICSKG